MWLFPSGQEMTMKISYAWQQGKIARAWNPMSTLNTEQCWLHTKNYLNETIFSSREET